MKRSFQLSLPVLVVSAAAAAFVGVSASGAQTITRVQRLTPPCEHGRTPIRSLPYTIDACGSYFLTGCLTGKAGENGITIQADDVTLDLNGFTLTGVPGSSSGIEVLAAEGVRITNGHLEGWGDDGVRAYSLQGGVLSGVQASGNQGNGLVLGIGSLVEGCTATNNALDGIVVGFGASVTDSSATGNGRDGIVGAIAATVTGCSISRCTARTNGEDGIETGDGCSVVDCATTLNGEDGIEVGVGSVVSGNAATLNGGRGIAAFDSLVRGNAARNNTGTQIDAADSTVIENHQ